MPFSLLHAPRGLAAIACAVVLFPAIAVRAAEAEEAPPPEPVIEIVNDGGVADVYRRDGADFATFAPEGEARVPTPEAQALQALQASLQVTLVSLDAAVGGSTPAACAADDCIGGNAVLGRMAMDTRDQHALVVEVLESWLGEPSRRPSTCLPEYRHGMSFESGGHDWVVLLSYPCGQYQIRRDGQHLVAATAARKPGLAQFNASFEEAGIPHRGR